MSRKCITGECKTCGNIKIFTFEYVPPETTFNNQSAKMVTGETLINPIGEKEHYHEKIKTYQENHPKGMRGILSL